MKEGVIEAASKSEGTLALPIYQERSRQSLERILSAAEIVLRKDGFAGFSITAVASASGVSIGGIYARVKGKRELMQLLKNRALQRLRKAQSKPLSLSFASYEEFVDALIEALTRGFRRDEDLHRALFAAAVEDDDLGKQGYANRRAQGEALVRRLTQLEPKFETCPSDALYFGADMGPAIILSRLRAPLDEGIVWSNMTEYLQIAVKSYFGALLNLQRAPLGKDTNGAVSSVILGQRRRRKNHVGI